MIWILLIAICVALLMILCGYTDIQLPVKREEGKLHVACVGDSITYGCTVPMCFLRRYPAALQRFLGADYQVVAFGLNDRTLQNTGNKPYRKEKAFQQSKAAKGYEFCGRIFDVERKLEDLPDTERAAKRQKLIKPIIDEYYAWIETIFKPSGKLKEAVTYAVNQKDFLCTFLYHGEVEASNNQVENAQRGVVIGRKNWLFCDTPKGAEASVIAYSILETAKANGLNPEKYLMHIFTVLPDRFAKDPNADIEDLLPWNQKIKELCKLGV